MRTYVAVDGGNSKTDVVIGDTDGRVLASVRGGGTCHQDLGLPETTARLRAMVHKARAAAGLDESRCFDHAALFLAGVDLPAEVELLTAAVAELGWATTCRVENDTFALVRAGTDAADAVAVVCGAGINCVGRDAAGRTARFPALGTLTGDWGGGPHLGKVTLWHAVRGEDGRGPATALSAAVASHFGASTAEEVGVAMHLGELDDGRVAELSPVLFAAAEAGDAVAREVVDRQATEIASLATVAARRLDLLDRPFAVVLGGGVISARHPLLLEPVRVQILDLAPKATITVLDAPPVLGAALAALDALAAPPESHHHLRHSLSPFAPIMTLRS